MAMTWHEMVLQSTLKYIFKKMRIKKKMAHRYAFHLEYGEDSFVVKMQGRGDFTG